MKRLDLLLLTVIGSLGLGVLDVSFYDMLVSKLIENVSLEFRRA